MKISNYTLHLLSLVEANDASRLANFLADARNVKKIWRRALRLKGWSVLSEIERGILELVATRLTRVKSELLMNTLIRIVKKLVPNLLTKFERRLYENYVKIKNMLMKLGKEMKNLFILRLSKDSNYLLSEAMKLTNSGTLAAEIIYRV